MEAVESMRVSGSGAAVTATSIASVSSIYNLTNRTVTIQGVPTVLAAGDRDAVAAQLEAVIAGSAFIPMEPADGHNRLILSMQAKSNGTDRTGAEDLYLVFRGQYGGPPAGPVAELRRIGRLTWTFGSEMSPVSFNMADPDLYLAKAVALDASGSSGLLEAINGGQLSLQTFPVTGYGGAIQGAPACAVIHDKGPAIGLLRVMMRENNAGIAGGVVPFHMRWR